MGVYNLLDGTIVPHYTGQSYHKLTPPLWNYLQRNTNWEDSEFEVIKEGCKFTIHNSHQQIQLASMAVEVAAPLLMLAEKEENAEIREFWDLSKGITYTMNFPELVGKYCVGVGFPGWLFTADEQGHMNLFHLFSRTLINLPDMDMLQGFAFQEELGCDHITYVQKALLSSDPLSSTDDYVLALIQGYPRTFAFWRPGSKSFTSVDSTIPYCAFSDVTWHDGHFYGLPRFVIDPSDAHAQYN
ncbi:hypothetical protein RND71_023704 [Anisodus tanguticus]|uniref:KIB1-4 beta-propeller domain-containing protein n=1 Tax=Anisodus tanguticus TaxID=243964 RepID=A0AAE1RT40_9SOLA|nr:hypothetical protein RND71_023704 [Anisodus tanguticus]